MRCTTSICSSVAVTAVEPGMVDGTYTDQNWPPTPPVRSRGMSVISVGALLVMSALAKSRPGSISRSAHG